MVQAALANELKAAQDESHPMRYVMRKSSPRLTTTKQLIETRDGSVAMLLAVNDAAPSAEDKLKDQTRLQGLLTDPGKQRHRKQVETQDTGRALKVLRVLPTAFLYQAAGTMPWGSGTVERFTFTPNPKFDPPDLETQVLTELDGEILVDREQQRVVRLEAHLIDDVDFGWGILGRLNKGGWITIDQTEVQEGVWRVTRFQMKMTARLLFKTKTFDTLEEQSRFTPMELGLSYQDGIALLRSKPAAVVGGR